MILMKDCSVEVVEALIADMLDLEGFSHWWFGIDRHAKDDVVEGLAAVVRTTLARNAEARP